MLLSKFAGFPNLVSRLKKFQPGTWLAVLLLAAQAAFAAGVAPVIRSGRAIQGPPIFLPASLLSVTKAPQTETLDTKGTAVPMAKAAVIQAAVIGVHSPNLQALAAALGLDPAQIGRRAFDDSTIGMEAVAGLSGDAVHAVAVKWRPAKKNQGQEASAEVAPDLYLLSWDGNGWQASYLTAAAGALTVQTLPIQGNAASLFAVIVYRGLTAVPYPVIFRFQDHHASVAWDGRADSASYTGYDYGSIQFEKAGSGGVPVMIATGRADPGLLMFPISDQQSGRGFQAATVYIWENDSYVPLRTEYTHNRDYVLYRFIAALHLHEFKTAYSLIDPQQFLKTNKPSLKLFRTRIQNKWPEFIDDRIFEVPSATGSDSGSHVFILRLGHGKMNVYHPIFTPGPTYRLAGLKRAESHE